MERIAEQEVILAIQDTTELNYTSHKALSGVGYLDSKSTRGLKVHSCLLVTTQGVPQGIIGQDVWARKLEQLGKAQTRHQRATKEKESQKWLDGLTTTETIVPQNVSVVTIADREADFYDLFAHSRRRGSELLIRGTQNRCLNNRTEHLWPAVESVEVVGTLYVELPRNPTRPSRIATLTLRYTTVTIQPPKNRAGTEQLAPITLQAILVREINSPPEVEPIEWLLLTTLEITSLQDVQKYVRWYSYRWLIERYHYVLKSGCQIEKLQLETAHRG